MTKTRVANGQTHRHAFTFVRATVTAALLFGASAARADVPTSASAPTPNTATPDRVALLGTYQRDALTKALAERGLTVDYAPQGKRVAGIVVKNLDVFLQEDGSLVSWLNVFHMTTREHIIAREVLLRPGDMWSDLIAEETRRRLADPLFSSYVVVMPVRAPDPNEVFVLVVTRDLFSLRLNSDFEYQGNVWSMVRLEPAENNFLGRRKRLSAVFEMDLGRYSVGPTYYDSNILGSRWQLIAQARSLIGRQSEQNEGSQSSTTLSYPLWSYRRRWSGLARVEHFTGTQRSFFGPSLRMYDDATTTTKEAIPWQYRDRSFKAETRVVRQFGEQVIQRVGAGYSLGIRRPDVFEDAFVGMPEVRAAFARDVLPRSELVSSPFLVYQLFTPRFITFRDIETFDLPEDVMMGPEVAMVASWSLPVLGSDRAFVYLSSSLEYTAELGRRGLLKLSSAASTRTGSYDDTFWDSRLSSSVFVASPKILSVGRLVMRLGVDRLLNNKGVRNVVVGGDTGLRGYPIGAFLGAAWFRGNVEARSADLRAAFTRIGMAVFWDFGHAAATFQDMVIHHDFGAGFRLLIPQLQPTVIRIDWAIATQGPTAKLPGRITAGFTQGF